MTDQRDAPILFYVFISIYNSVCSIFIEHGVPKRRHRKFRRQGITQKKQCNNIYNMYDKITCSDKMKFEFNMLHNKSKTVFMKAYLRYVSLARQRKRRPALTPRTPCPIKKPHNGGNFLHKENFMQIRYYHKYQESA